MNRLMDSYEYTCEALSIIYESLESDSEVFKSFLASGIMMETSMPNDIIMESVSDTFSSISKGIHKFIESVKSFFKNVLLHITASKQDLDKLAKEVEKVIKDKDNIDFEISGYEFTVSNTNPPNIDELGKIVTNYNADMANLKDLKIKDIKDNIIDWMTESNLDRLRGEILGTNNSIPESDYLSEIRKYYRNGEDSTSTIKINKDKVLNIISKSNSLEELKKSAIKDRDEFVTLLTKTENFFGRTIQTYYKDNTKHSNVSKISIDNNKFSKTDNDMAVDENAIKIISAYAMYKNKQVKKLSGMINLVVCERVNAIKDQIEMERDILKKCLFNKSSKVTDSYDISSSCKNYVVEAMESNISSYKLYDELSRNILLQESNFIVDSINNGSITSLMEADEKTSKLGNNIKKTIMDIVESIISAFRKRAIGDTKKYKPWIEDIMKEENKLAEKASTYKQYPLLSFAKPTETNKMVTDLTGAINTAYSNTDYNDVSWASNILSDYDSMDKLSDVNLRKKLKNYYSCGKPVDAFKANNVSGSQLANSIGTLTNYILNYDKITSGVEKLSSTLKSKSEGFKVQESVNPNTILGVLGCPICETDLVLCSNYDSVFNPITEANSPLAGPTGSTMKNAQNSVKNETKIGNDAKKSATDTKEVSDKPEVNNDDKVRDDSKFKDLKSETNEGEKKGNSAATKYKNAVDNFFKVTTTTYITARESQFYEYLKVLSDIDGQPPKFNDKGEYIPKSERKDNNKKETKEK